jgi:hypothetical protein
MPKYTDDQLDLEVYLLLKKHIGREWAIGRWEMVKRLFDAEAAWPQNDDNLADRDIRESVARLRRQGRPICDMGDGRGRFLAASLEEYQAFRLAYGGRAFEVLETLRAMDRTAEQTWVTNPLQPSLI